MSVAGMDGRLKYLLFSGSYKKDLIDVWHIIQPEMDNVLTAFYAHLSAEPALASILQGRDLPRIKNAQYAHWEGLFLNGFDEEYVARTEIIGRAHAVIGLAPQWFLGAYCMVLSSLFDVLDKKMKWKGTKKAKLRNLLTQVVFMDADSIMTVYATLTEQKKMEDQKEIMDKMHVFLSENVTQQVASVAAATEELSSTIHSLSTQSSEVATVTEKSREQGAAAAAINDQLMQSTKDIASVTELIQSVAEQTNLLALNAAIEAARAGDSGRGFAVVADEVKKLAQQTSSATDDIRQKVNDIQRAVEQAVRGSSDMLSNVDDISKTMGVMSSSVQEQSQATSDIGESMTQMQHSVQDFVSKM